MQVIHHVERQLPVRVTKPFSQRLDLAALRYELVAFTSLWISQTDPASWPACSTSPQSSRRTTTGDADLLAQVVAKNTRDLYRITNAILASAPGRDRTG